MRDTWLCAHLYRMVGTQGWSIPNNWHKEIVYMVGTQGWSIPNNWHTGMVYMVGTQGWSIPHGRHTGMVYMVGTQGWRLAVQETIHDIDPGFWKGALVQPSIEL